MGKVKLDSRVACVFPMPTVLVGTIVEGRPNFAAVGWISKVNTSPCLFAFSLGKHRTNGAIEEHREFSVNWPDVSLLEKTDYCGIVSGAKTDKSGVFQVFYGESDKAPLIEECPICMAFSLYDIVKLPSHTMYIGEMKEIFVEDRVLTDGNPDIEKIKPFTLTMPDNRYWAVGERLGAAWKIGKNLIEKPD